MSSDGVHGSAECSESFVELGFTNGEKGFLLHSIVDSKHVELVGIVIPKCRRSQLLALAHDKAGHLSDKKQLEIFKRIFSWPNITCDVHKYVKSCREVPWYTKIVFKQ